MVALPGLTERYEEHVMCRDEDHEALVRQMILRDSRLSEQPIEVSASGGVVTLQGTVQSYSRRLAAAQIAASVDGVIGVVDELHVEPPGYVPDELIAESVRHALEARADVTRPTIAVSVKYGVVTLSGKVGNHWERILAEDTTLATKGVISVRNMLIVDLDGQIEDESLSRDIQEVISYTRGLRNSDVSVSVTGDTAVLAGDVDQHRQKETVESVVRRFRVSRVQNNIRVTDRPRPAR
jgi:osmotically-inducible protein OsmY